MLVEKPRDNYFALSWLEPFMRGHKGFIAGGCFKNIFNGEKVKDLDIFFENMGDFSRAVDYFDVLCKEGKYDHAYTNPNVVAYKHKRTGVVLELCRKIFGTPTEIISQFDFTITKFAYFKKEVETQDPLELLPETHTEHWVVMDDHFFEHLHTKRLVTDDKILYPMSTFERMIRYIRYGYMPCKETKLKIATAIHDSAPELLTTSRSLYDGVD